MKLFALKSAAWTTLALCLVFATVASATPITPGMTVSPALPLIPVQTGAILADTGVVAITTAGLSGFVREVVFTDFTTGNLDFVYAITNNGPDALTRSTLTSFVGFTTDVGFDNTANPNLLGSIPSVAPLTIDRGAAGDVIGFNFFTTLTPSAFTTGTSSYNLVIETNATSWTKGTLGFTDGGPTSVDGFAPTTPEPASYLLMGTGMLICAFFLRRNMGTSSAGITAA